MINQKQKDSQENVLKSQIDPSTQKSQGKLQSTNPSKLSTLIILK